MIAEDLLALLRCPETHQPLSVATAEQLARVEASRTAGTLQDRTGKPITDPIESGLVRADGTLLFPIRKGLPILLLDEALPLGVS